MRRLTICLEREGRGGAEYPGVGYAVLHQADVAAHVGWLGLGDVQVPRLLGDEAPAVLGHERRELVEHPAVDDLWNDQTERRKQAEEVVSDGKERHNLRKKHSY